MTSTVPVRPAATVILLRDEPGGIETWLLRRISQLAFAAGMSVFPGGRVEPGDGSIDVPWVGEEPAAIAARFGCSVSQAHAAVVAAVRETFEETGVLLTDPSGVASPEVRRAVESGRTPFASVLQDQGLGVDADLIRPWTRWVTPQGEPRRYDTYFYVAALPAGAVAQADSGEAVDAGWIRPADALEQWRRGERPMLPPTYLTLQGLTEYRTVQEVLAASTQRSLDAVRPDRSVDSEGTVTVRLPDGTRLALPGTDR